MERTELFNALCELASALGIELSSERLTSRRSAGGLVKLHGHWRVVLDEDASIPDRIATLSTALARFDLQGMALTDVVRRQIDAMSRRIPKGRHDNTLPLEIPARKPGLRWARRRNAPDSDEG